MPEPPRPGPAATRHVPLRLAPLPAALLATLATAVAAYLIGGPGRSPSPPLSGPLWGLLGGAMLLAGGAVTGVAAAGVTRARTPPAPHRAESDLLAEAREEIAVLRRAAEATLAEAHALAGRAPSAALHLAQRVESAAFQQLECLDELREELHHRRPGHAGDPELLDGLCHLGRHAARMRRHAASLAVLCGAAPRPRPSRPAPVSEVLGSCVAEARHRDRVRPAPAVAGTLRGEAVADVTHLLLELIHNATDHSSSRTQVRLGARPVAGGLAVEVEDRGVGMTPAEQRLMNAVLTGAERAAATRLLAEGRTGLCVVATLARRHRATVRLHDNVYGGVRAVVTLPRELLADQAAAGRVAGATTGATTGAALVAAADGAAPPRERPWP